MIDPPDAPHPLVVHWLQRHRRSTSFILHMFGIPPTILGVLLFPVYTWTFSFPVFVLSVGLFLGGYALQFAGHVLEGTDPGEVIYFKKLFGIPYVEFPDGHGPFHSRPDAHSSKISPAASAPASGKLKTEPSP